MNVDLVQLQRTLEEVNGRIKAGTMGGASSHITGLASGYYQTPGIAPQGPGGMVSGGQITGPIFNTVKGPSLGLIAGLRSIPSTLACLNVGIITGQTPATNADGSLPLVEAQDCCDDAPVAGLYRMCQWSLPMGGFRRDSRAVSLCDVQQDAYCDMPVTLVGDPINPQRPGGRFGASSGDGLLPNLGYSNSNMLNNLRDKTLAEFAGEMMHSLSPMYVNGNPNGKTGLFANFKGMASLIGTGYFDSITGEPCPAADSTVVDVEEVLGEGGIICKRAAAFVALLRHLINESRQCAIDSGLGITDGKFYGPIWMRDCIINAIACGEGGCTCCGDDMDVAGQKMVTMTEAMLQRKNMMMDGSYIMLDGSTYEWVVDSSDRYNSYDKETGQYRGRLFYTPTTVRGGTVPVFYKQYVPWNTPRVREFLRTFAPDSTSPMISPNGEWLIWKKQSQNLCFQLGGMTRNRLVHHTPQLAFQLKGIVCCSTLAPRPEDGGGRTEGPAPYPCNGTPGDVLAEVDKSQPFCIAVKDPETGMPTAVTVYWQCETDCYADCNGLVYDIGDICPTEGECPVVFSPTELCYNPYADEPAQTVFSQEDGTYNTAADGSGDAVALEDGVTGTLWEGACPVPFAVTAWCFNPLMGGAAQTVWLQEDGTYNTNESGSGDVVEVDPGVNCTLTEGACPTAKKAKK